MTERADEPQSPRRAFSRRSLLAGLVVLGAAAGCTPTVRAARPSGTPRAVPHPGAVRMGMHLHASASEGVGSMRSQLAQAATHGFDVAWFTEHDWRRRRLLFRPSWSFVPEEKVYGGVWTLDPVPDEGRPAGGSGGRLVPDPTSPHDPAPRKASLRLRATGTTADPATVGYRVHAEGTSRANYRGRLAGRALSVDVLATRASADAWAELLLTLSHHPGSGQRPSGVIELLYRLRPGQARRVSTQGTRAVVELPLTPGDWQTLAVDVVSDLHDAWPDIDPRDNALHDIALRATSQNRAPVEVCFGYLRFDEQAGYDAVGVEHDLLAAYASQEPGVLGLVGTEISLGPHLNQFGGTQAPYDYGAVATLSPRLDVVPSVIDFIHAQGGLASVNHPSAPGDPATAARSIALHLLAQGARTDILEVGYGSAGALPQHLAAWDTLSRNGLFVTGNGVSDDHSGQKWESLGARYYTTAWASTRSEGALMDALAGGRVFVGYLGSYDGTLDMTVDDAAPMGAVSVATTTTRRLRLSISGLPDGGAVQVLRGAVDRPGSRDPGPNTSVVATLGARDLAARPEREITTGEDCFHRAQVIDRDGAVVAFGQPIWTLQSAPAPSVPPSRRARA